MGETVVYSSIIHTCGCMCADTCTYVHIFMYAYISVAVWTRSREKIKNAVITVAVKSMITATTLTDSYGR